MTVKEMAEALSLTLIAGQGGADHEISGCYIGDLLSWVMGRAESGDVWLTVMGNVNAIAVATLKDVACIVLTDGASLDEEARSRADEQDVAVYSTQQSSYQIGVGVFRLLPQ